MLNLCIRMDCGTKKGAAAGGAPETVCGLILDELLAFAGEEIDDLFDAR